MSAHLLNILLIFASTIAGASVLYCLLCISASVRFASERRGSAPPANNLPPVSLLKPLKGTDPEMYASLRSHCVQDYPQYEILFGVSRTDDPAIPLIEKLIAEFPHHAIRLVRCDKNLGANGKVSSLAQLAAVAAHDFFLVNDSDVRVETDYLRTVMTELQAPGTGLVTCLYCGVPAPLSDRVWSHWVSAPTLCRASWRRVRSKVAFDSGWDPPWRFAGATWKRLGDSRRLSSIWRMITNWDGESRNGSSK